MQQKEFSLEREAQEKLSSGQLEEAHRIFKEAAAAHRQAGDHRQAAVCYASAASIWGKVYGETSFYSSAQLYEEAAREAQKYFDFEYSAMLYKYAAINYERDGEFDQFSACFYHSKESRRKSLMHFIKKNENIKIIAKSEMFFKWCLMSLACLIWGYGEKPFRTLFMGAGIVSIFALLYKWGGLAQNGVHFDPSYFDALYFSVVTITTVGYGDISPVGLSRPFAMAEAFFGIFVMPLFIVALSRKYLRV